MAARQDGQAEIGAERVAFIIGAEQAARLKDGHHLLHEAGKLFRMAEMDVESIERAAFEPALDFVRDRFRRSDEGAAASRARFLDRLAQRQALRHRLVGDALGVCVEAVPGGFQRRDRERRVGIVAAEIVPAKRAAEFGQRLIEALLEFAIATLDCLRLRVRIANIDEEAGKDDDLVRVAAEAGGAAFSGLHRKPAPAPSWRHG